MRQSGRTTRQMQRAKKGAVYVWVNGHIGYPKNLAQTLGRDDLEIKPRSWLRAHNMYGRWFSEVVIDHAIGPPSCVAEYEAMMVAKMRTRPEGES